MDRSAGCAIRTMFAAATCILGVTPASAQWRLDAQAGRLQYDAAPDAVSTTVALGVTRSTSASSHGFSLGVPFSTDEPLWAALGSYRRYATGGELGFGIDLAANAFGYRIAARDSSALIPLPSDDESETGWGAAGEAMPLVFWRGGLVSAETRAGLVGYTSGASNADSFDRRAFVADAALSVTPFRGFTSRVDARYVDVVEGGFPYAGVTLAWSRRFTVWGSVGQWFDDAVDAASWDAGASVPLGERVALTLNGRHDPIDPVYATPSRTSWGAGVSVWLGDAARAVPEPLPAAYEGGVATIALEEEDVEGVPSIAGDFNEWTPTPMVRSDGAWVHRVPLEAGVYNYSFIDEAGNWFVPEGTPGRRADGMGGFVAVLVVTNE